MSHKRLIVLAAVVGVATMNITSALPQARPSEEKMAEIKACLDKAGIKPPQRGSAPNDKELAAAEKCFKAAGVEVPSRMAPPGR